MARKSKNTTENTAAEKVDAAIADKKAETQASALVRIALAGCKLFHDADGTAFADVIVDGYRETWPVKRAGFKAHLRRKYYDGAKSAPSSEAVQTALGVIEAKAIFEGEEREVFTRVAGHGGNIYIDLCDAAWRCVEIRPGSWSVISNPPVRFVRSKGMRPLPVPDTGGDIALLRPFVNLKNERDLILVIAWLLAALLPRSPYPILTFIGEAGTAKSTLARILRALIDPNKAKLRSLPRNDQDLFISATNMWLLAFDNVSSIPQWLSDGLCRIATGGGHATRALYTNDDEALFDAMRPILLNGIVNFIEKGDLAERAIVCVLDPIPEHERLDEAELWARFEQALPRILGGLYDCVAIGLANLPSTVLELKPRMADFAKWGVAACPDLETEDGKVITFINAYAGNRADLVENVLESDPVAVALRTFIAKEGGRWEGTSTDLYDLLCFQVGEKKAAQKDHWPQTVNKLGRDLTRLASDLRKVGVDIQRGSRHDQRGRRIFITQTAPTDYAAKNASEPSEPSEPNEVNDLGRTHFRTHSSPAQESVRESVRPNPLKNNGSDASDASDAFPRQQSNGEPKRVCEECRFGGEPLELYRDGVRKALLHPVCFPAWKSNGWDDLEIPASLRRT